MNIHSLDETLGKIPFPFLNETPWRNTRLECASIPLERSVPQSCMAHVSMNKWMYVTNVNIFGVKKDYEVIDGVSVSLCIRISSHVCQWWRYSTCFFTTAPEVGNNKIEKKKTTKTSEWMNIVSTEVGTTTKSPVMFAWFWLVSEWQFLFGEWFFFWLKKVSTSYVRVP